ncbi:hypothetical protein ABTK13_23755, partial [Acinetobacter baumannii]
MLAAATVTAFRGAGLLRSPQKPRRPKLQTEQQAGRFSLIPSLPALPRRRLLAACALAFGLTGLAAAP